MGGRGCLICLTQLWPKVSCHIPDPAGTLPSPKHGALGKGEGGGEEWAGEVLGQVAWGAVPAWPREARPTMGVPQTHLLSCGLQRVPVPQGLGLLTWKVGEPIILMVIRGR